MSKGILHSLTRRNLLTSTATTALGASAAAALPVIASRPAAAADSVRVLVVADPFYFSLKEVLGDFTKETGIEVQLESLAYDALQARLVSSFVSKTSDADVITVDQMWSGQYLDNGWITPLDDMIKSDKEIKLDDFIPEVLYSLNTWRGKFVTLPVAAYAQGTIYRTDVFKELGLTPPDQIAAKDWTWDKYLETLKAIQGKEVGGKKLFGTVICGSQPVPIVHMFTQVAASFGGRWFKKFPEAPWDFDPEIASDTMVKAAEFYKELYDLSPPEIDQLCLVRCRDAVRAGRYRHVLLVDALFLPGQGHRLHDRSRIRP